MHITNTFLTVYDCNIFYWVGVINSEDITSYLSLCRYWGAQHQAFCICNHFVMTVISMGKGLDDNNIREIRGGGMGGRIRGNGRLPYLKKCLIQHGSFSWLGLIVCYLCIIQ